MLICLSCNNGKKEEDAAPVVPARETELKSRISQFPDSLLLRETLIQYYRDNGDYDKALLETQDAIIRDTTNPRFYDIQAILYFENGDTLSAISSFQKAIQIFPSPEYLISLGTLYAQTRNVKAHQIADELESLEKVNAKKEALFIKGLYHSYIGEKQKALEYFDKALAMNFTFMEAYREKAIALYDLGKYQEALVVLDKAVTLQNNFEEGYYYKGRTLEKLNRIKDAVEAYQMALAYDPDYIEAKDALGRLGIR